MTSRGGGSPGASNLKLPKFKQQSPIADTIARTASPRGVKKTKKKNVYGTDYFSLIPNAGTRSPLNSPPILEEDSDYDPEKDAPRLPDFGSHGVSDSSLAARRKKIEEEINNDADQDFEYQDLDTGPFSDPPRVTFDPGSSDSDWEDSDNGIEEPESSRISVDDTKHSEQRSSESLHSKSQDSSHELQIQSLAAQPHITPQPQAQPQSLKLPSGQPHSIPSLSAKPQVEQAHSSPPQLPRPLSLGHSPQASEGVSVQGAEPRPFSYVPHELANRSPETDRQNSNGSMAEIDLTEKPSNGGSQNESHKDESSLSRSRTLFDRLKRKLTLSHNPGLAPGAFQERHQVYDEEAQKEKDDTSPQYLEEEARRLVEQHAQLANQSKSDPQMDDWDDVEDDVFKLDDVGRPNNVQAGVLSSLLQLYHHPEKSGSHVMSDDSSFMSAGDSGSRLKNKFNSNVSRLSLDNPFRHRSRPSASDDEETSTPRFLGTSASSVSGLLKHQRNKSEADLSMPTFNASRPKHTKKKNNLLTKKKGGHQARITVHIADVLQRQRFILRICKAMMMYGAPTHRLEEYMVMTARVLAIDGHFVYFPGCMIVSFGDAATRTSQMQLVRCVQGLDLSKLDAAHKIYKDVVHDMVGVEDANARLDELFSRRQRYPRYVQVLLYAFGSSMVAPWAFKANWPDMPICFLIGACVGFLQYYVSPRSALYANVFEVTSSIVVSFLARAIGSVRDGELFCFAAIAQGSLAIILPGYIILCGSLELQSRNLVAGSVRMFYAIIYSLFLGFGITLGSALYGWIDKNAVSSVSCPPQMSHWFYFLFVPAYSITLGLLNQARFRQLPVMVLVSGGGYVVTYFSGQHFKQSTEFTACLGAFAIGILGNLYSRMGKGMAVAAMLPGIFVQVPSGIASQSSLLTGVNAADEITSNSSSSASTTGDTGIAFGVTMIEVAIGISVGLIAATIVIYPFGKKRTGLFTL